MGNLPWQLNGSEWQLAVKLRLGCLGQSLEVGLLDAADRKAA